MATRPELRKATPKVVFRRSEYFKQTLARHPEVEDKLAEFILLKSKDPLAQFGAKDAHFSGGGILGATKAVHAHLTRDISVLYKRSGKDPTHIDLIAVLSHAESGTGTPPDKKAQKVLAKRIEDMKFEQALQRSADFL